MKLLHMIQAHLLHLTSPQLCSVADVCARQMQQLAMLTVFKCVDESNALPGALQNICSLGEGPAE
jgi:hypothetical protein